MKYCEHRLDKVPSREHRVEQGKKRRGRSRLIGSRCTCRYMYVYESFLGVSRSHGPRLTCLYADSNRTDHSHIIIFSPVRSSITTTPVCSSLKRLNLRHTSPAKRPPSVPDCHRLEFVAKYVLRCTGSLSAIRHHLAIAIPSTVGFTIRIFWHLHLCRSVSP